MSASLNKKIKLLYLLEILKEYSDEQHPLTSFEIIDKLSSYGISVERKAIYSDIEVLITAGFDIIKTKTPKSGYFLADREFEKPELSLLADAVMASNFITSKKTREILKKLEKFMSVYDAIKFRNRIFINNKNKCENEEIYYIIDKLQSAIDENKKVEFLYFKHYFEGGTPNLSEKTFKISPYALVWEDDNYYLIGNNEKYNNLMHLRVDRIKKVIILKEKSRNFEEVSTYKGFFDTADYTTKAFNMFGGERATIELLCKNNSFEQIIDRLGKNVTIRKYDNEHFLVLSDSIVSEGLSKWILQFSGDIEVLSPPKLRNMVEDRVERLCNIYKKEH